MTIPFEKLKARLLANPKVRAEYDALAPEFEIAAELLRARLRAGLSQTELATVWAPAIHRCTSGKRRYATEHQDLVTLCTSNGQQSPRAAIGSLTAKCFAQIERSPVRTTIEIDDALMTKRKRFRANERSRL